MSPGTPIRPYYEDGSVTSLTSEMVGAEWVFALGERINALLRVEAAARDVVNAVGPLTPREWAFETPPQIQEAIIVLEDTLDGRR